MGRKNERMKLNQTGADESRNKIPNQNDCQLLEKSLPNASHICRPLQVLEGFCFVLFFVDSNQPSFARYGCTMVALNRAIVSMHAEESIRMHRCIARNCCTTGYNHIGTHTHALQIGSAVSSAWFCMHCSYEKLCCEKPKLSQILTANNSGKKGKP